MRYESRFCEFCPEVPDDRWFESQQRLRIFLFTTLSRPALGPTQPPIQCVPGAVSLRVKRPGREADHSLPSSAEVKNAWSYTSTLQYSFMVWYLVKKKSTGTTSPLTLPYTSLKLLLHFCSVNFTISSHHVKSSEIRYEGG
jgi:hypothetical protein